MAGSTTPQGYQLVAQSHDDPAVQAIALLRGADLLLSEAVEGRSASDEALSPAEALPQAATMYQQVADSKAAPVYRVNALLGLAAVLESQQQFEQAEQAYNQAAELAEQANLIDLAGQVQARLALLPELAKPVIFAEQPAATQPAEQDVPAAVPAAIESESEAEAVAPQPASE